MKLHVIQKKIIADTLTPVSVYLRVRDQYPMSCLLESSDYHGQESSYSFVAFNPIASFKANQNTIHISKLDAEQKLRINQPEDVLRELKQFAHSFEVNQALDGKLSAGLFGFIGYDAVRYFEDI